MSEGAMLKIYRNIKIVSIIFDTLSLQAEQVRLHLCTKTAVGVWNCPVLVDNKESTPIYPAIKSWILLLNHFPKFPSLSLFILNPK